MSLQSLLAKAGLRTATLGSIASLAMAFPLTEGSYDPAAHTDASRIGFYCDRTPGNEYVGINVMGTDGLQVGASNTVFNGNATFMQLNARLYDSSAVPSYDVSSRTVFDASGATSVDAANRFLSGTTGTSIDYEQHFLYDASSVLSADYTGRALYDTANNITLDWNNRTLGTVGSAQVWSIAVAPSTVGAATFNIEPGTAPASPVDGDMWTDTTGLYVQINGITVGPLSAGGGGTIGGTATAGRVAYGTGSNTIGSSAGFTYDSTLSQFSTSQTVLAASGAGSFDATFFRTTRAPSNTNSVSQFAIEAQADLTGSGAANPGTITGVFASAFNNMTGGSLANLNGVVANVQSNGNTGVTTAAYGFKAQASVGVGNTITTYYGLYLSSPSVSGTITNKYGIYQQSATDLNFFAGVVAVGGATPSTSTTLATPASTISASSLRISHGVAPTSPVNGDVWTTTGGFFVRINGSTQQLIAAASSNASTFAYWNSSSQLASASTWAVNITGGTFQLDTTSAGSTATNSASQVSLGMSWQGTLNASAVIRTLGVSCTPSVSGVNASSSYYSIYATLLPSLTSSLRYTSSDMCAIYGSTSFQGSATSGTSVNTIRGAQFDINVTMSGASGTTTIPNVYGVHVRPASFSSATGGTTTISAYYGIYLDTLTTSGSGTTTITNRYGVYQADASAMNNFAGVTGIGAAPSSTTRLLLAASTAGVSSLRLPHGTAPSAPVDGDMWTTTAGLFVRINGSTVGPLT